MSSGYLRAGDYATALPAKSSYAHECRFAAPQFTFSTKEGVLFEIHGKDGVNQIDLFQVIADLRRELTETRQELAAFKKEYLYDESRYGR